MQLVFSRDIEEVSSSVNPPTRNTKANVIPFNMKSVQQSTTTTSIPFMKEFLNYNRINAEDVTLERGEQIFKKYREYFELSAIRQAEGIGLIKELCKSLAKTQYSFSAELLVSEKDVESLSFYDKQQSCVSFTFNVNQRAWAETSYPDQPIPILFKTPGVLIVPKIVRNNESGDMGEYAYEVSWFREQVIVDKYLMEDVGILSCRIPQYPLSKLVWAY